MDCRNVQIFVGVDECDFSFEGLLDLIKANFNDRKSVLNCVVECFSSGRFIKSHNFRVCAFDDSQHIWGQGKSFSTHEFD